MHPTLPRLLLSTLITLILPLLLLSPRPAVAQTTTFQITPALTQLNVDPGDQHVFDITLHNQSPTPQAVRVYTRNFAAKGMEGEMTFSDDNTMSYAASSWLILAKSELLIPAGQKQDVTVQLIVPPHAEPGGKYASVIFEQIPTDSAVGGLRDSQVNVSTRLSSLIFLTVSGDIQESGHIITANGDKCDSSICGLDAPAFADRGPLDYQFIFNNTGNVHLRPRGYITITQFGRQVDRLTVEDRAVLPNSQRRFQTDWPRTFLLGPYQATLHLTYGTTNQTLTTSTTLWSLPWQLALTTALLTLAGTGILVSRKHFKLKRLRREIWAANIQICEYANR